METSSPVANLSGPGRPSAPQTHQSTWTTEDVEVWKQVFQEFMQEVKPRDTWTLTVDKDLLPNVQQPEWVPYQQWAFARFQCSCCARSWASAQVQVLFHMRWSKRKSKGQVKMRAFAQRCRKCSQPPFEVPQFTQENISRILNNLMLRILQKCYREGLEPVKAIPTVKDISLKGSHDSGNCEACIQGVCVQGRLQPGLQSPLPPPLPVPSEDVKEPKVTATAINLSCLQLPLKADNFLEPTACPKLPDSPQAASASKAHNISRPSTAPRMPAQQMPPVTYPAPKATTLMPSPTDRSTTRNTMAREAGLKEGRQISRSSCYSGPPQTTTSLPVSWNPRANTSYQGETIVHFAPSREGFCEDLSCRKFICCPSCLIFIIVIVIVIRLVTG